MYSLTVDRSKGMMLSTEPWRTFYMVYSGDDQTCRNLMSFLSVSGMWPFIITLPSYLLSFFIINLLRVTFTEVRLRLLRFLLFVSVGVTSSPWPQLIWLISSSFLTFSSSLLGLHRLCLLSFSPLWHSGVTAILSSAWENLVDWCPATHLPPPK